jgi:trehalose 6-phosphate phosphatase
MGGNGRVTTESILAKRHAHLLSSFAMGNLLLAFDYDGTLAPIAPSPPAARMRAPTRLLLRRVALHYPSVVISGRALDDISRRMRGIPLWYVFGNHGSEPLTAPSAHHRTADWVRVLRRSLPADPGVVIEDKRHSVTVHFRHARDPEAARDATLRAALQMPEVRVVGGRKALNLLQRGGPDKASALRYAVRAFACDTAVYVGDDDTDEDAFVAFEGSRMLGVRIGKAASGSRARFHLEDQAEIDVFLERLLDLRTPGSGPRAGRPLSGR